MKLLMIIVDAAKKEELEVFLERSGLVVGYTEIAGASGRGSTGLRLGSAAFPATSAVIFSILPATEVEAVRRGVEELCASCHTRPRMVAWTVEDVL